MKCVHVFVLLSSMFLLAPRATAEMVPLLIDPVSISVSVRITQGEGAPVETDNSGTASASAQLHRNLLSNSFGEGSLSAAVEADRISFAGAASGFNTAGVGSSLVRIVLSSELEVAFDVPDIGFALTPVVLQFVNVSPPSATISISFFSTLLNAELTTLNQTIGSEDAVVLDLLPGDRIIVSGTVQAGALFVPPFNGSGSFSNSSQFRFQVSDNPNNLVECQSNLTQCVSDLGGCLTNAATCESDLNLALGDLASCNATLTQLATDVASCNDSLTACSTDLTQTTTSLSQCSTALDSTSTQLSEAQSSLDAALSDLAQCLLDPGLQDSDGDGVPDPGDLCPNTATTDLADALGCSLHQFCSMVNATNRVGSRVCRKSDWVNDEPLMKGRERDCTIDKRGRGRDDDLCVPNPEF